MSTSKILATVNACMTLAALLSATAGYRAIVRGHPDRHKRLMLVALGASAIFVIVFVFRYYRFGPAPMNARGIARLAYLFLLVTHEAVSVAVLPAVLATAAIGLFGSRAAHKDIARMTFPLWLYVMATGLVVYMVLYVYPGG